jgi:hypothetical protein
MTQEPSATRSFGSDEPAQLLHQRKVYSGQMLVWSRMDWTEIVVWFCKKALSFLPQLAAGKSGCSPMNKILPLFIQAVTRRRQVRLLLMNKWDYATLRSG